MSLNAVLAIALVVVGSIVGIASGMAFLGPLALVVGPVIGIASAIAVCGGLAVLLDLRGVLIEIRDALRDGDDDYGLRACELSPLGRAPQAEAARRPEAYT